MHNRRGTNVFSVALSALSAPASFLTLFMIQLQKNGDVWVESKDLHYLCHRSSGTSAAAYPSPGPWPGQVLWRCSVLNLRICAITTGSIWI